MYDLPMIMAQAIPVPFDVSQWTVYGPLGIACGWLLWKNARLEERLDNLISVHKTEIAAKDALVSQLQEKRLEDQKVLIPLTHSLTTVLELQVESRR